MTARAQNAEIVFGGKKVPSCVRDALTTRIQNRRKLEAGNG